MNMFVFMGRAVKDAEISVSGETKIAKFNLAVDRTFKKEGQDSADFFQLTAFGKRADFCDNYVKKGVKFLVTGHIQNNNYTDKEGKKHYQDAHIIDSIEFCEKKSDKPKENFETKEDDFVSIPDDLDVSELPFN